MENEKWYIRHRVYLVAGAVVLFMLLLICSARAADPSDSTGNWTEINVSFLGAPYIGADNFTVQPAIRIVNFIDGKGIGGEIDVDEQYAAILAIRLTRWHEIPLVSGLMDSWFSAKWRWQWFLLTSSNLSDGQLSNDLRNGLGTRFDFGMEEMDLEFRTLWQSRRGEPTLWTPGVVLVFRPSKLMPGVF